MAIQTTLITASNAIVYTSTGSATAVTFMSVCNHSGSDVTVDIHVPLSSSTPAADANLMISQLTINAGDTYILYQGGEKIILSQNDLIRVNSSDIASAVTVIVSYIGV